MPYPGREEKKITLVIIPHHGASLFQWKMPRLVWYGGLFLVLGVLGWAGYTVSLDIRYREELKKLHAERLANKRLAGELLKGKEAVMRTAQLELELRKMLRYKSAKALFNANNVGGPSEEDVRHLTQILDEQAAEAAKQAETDMSALLESARKREKSFSELRKYVDKRRSLLAARPTAWPVKGWVTSGFGGRPSPMSGEKGFHGGVDIANDFGAPVRATAEGRVAYAGWEGGYGKLVVLDHGHGFTTYYGHLSEIKVALGQTVKRGGTVGLMGQTGEATGPHVHYEIRVYGAAVDPTKYME